jgi:DNA-binding CsgD family transcriptional regulator
VLGRLAESAQVLDGAVESARLTGNVQTLAWGLFNRSISALMAGDVETALRTGAESVEVGRALDDGFLSAHAGIMLAAAVLESGDPVRGVELLVTAGGGDGIPVVPGGWRAMFLEVLTRGLLALDRVDEAAVAAGRAGEVAALVGLPRPAAMAHRASAAVALHRGDAATAVAEARASVAAAELAAAAVDAALSREVLGRALARAGDPVAAIVELERASADFDRCGATRYRDRADQELRRLGRRAHHRSASGEGRGGVEALSGRELEVARLVVDRRTNAEIAAELFLSLKTVETHMRHIFVKLGVPSRRRWLASWSGAASRGAAYPSGSSLQSRARRGPMRDSSSRWAAERAVRRRSPLGVRATRTMRWSASSVNRRTSLAWVARSTSSTVLWWRRSRWAARSVTLGEDPWPRTAKRSWCWAGVTPTLWAWSSLHRTNRRRPSRKSRSRSNSLSVRPGWSMDLRVDAPDGLMSHYDTIVRR